MGVELNGDRSTGLSGVADEGAIRPLLRAVRAHKLLVVGSILAALAGAVAFLAIRTPTYEATTNVLVSPLPQEDQFFRGLDLIRDSGDATRTVQTAATLLQSQTAAERTAQELGDDLTARKVLKRVTVDPIGESNIVGVTATDDTAAGAARLADAFTEQALAIRDETLNEQLGPAINRTQGEVRALPPGSAAQLAASERLSQLRAVQETGDPTLTLQERATVPSAPSGAGPVIVIPLALMAGFALGAGGALLRELLDRRLSDAEEAFSIYPVPVLARVPILTRKEFRPPADANWHIPAPVRQPFQSLVVQLEQRARGLGTVIVTSPSKGDGKTTSSVNLAVSIAANGRRVVLIDGDLRSPRVATEMRLAEPRKQSELAIPGTDVRRLLERPSADWPLFVLGVQPELEDPSVSEAALRRLPRLIDEAKGIADVVVVDTPPLGEVADALRLIPRVDDLLLVVRVGNTLRTHLSGVSELLDRGGHQAEGCILLDSVERTGAYGYGYGAGGIVDDLVLGSTDGHERVPERPQAADEEERQSSWAER